MKKQRPSLQKKYAAICAEFARLSSIKDNGITKYSYAWILHTIAHKYFLSEDYIAKIVRNEPPSGYTS